MGSWSRVPRHTGDGVHPVAHHASPSMAMQGDQGVCLLWQSLPSHPWCLEWVQVMGATGALCHLGALHGSQEEYKSLFKERLQGRSP